MQANVRGRLALSLLLLVPLGIGTRFYAGPTHAQVPGHAGGVLYVTLWTVAVVLMAPHLSPGTAGGGVLFVTCGLEFLQPWHSLAFQTVRQMFTGHALVGSTFGWWDLLHYGLGALLGALLVWNIRRTTPDEWEILPGKGCRSTPNYIFQGREV